MGEADALCAGEGSPGSHADGAPSGARGSLQPQPPLQVSIEHAARTSHQGATPRDTPLEKCDPHMVISRLGRAGQDVLAQVDAELQPTPRVAAMAPTLNDQRMQTDGWRVATDASPTRRITGRATTPAHDAQLECACCLYSLLVKNGRGGRERIDGEYELSAQAVLHLGHCAALKVHAVAHTRKLARQAAGAAKERDWRGWL